MSLEQNKALVLQACQDLSDRNLERFFAVLADDLTWTMPFYSRHYPFGGVKNKAEMTAAITAFLTSLERYSFNVDHVTAEDDRVAVEGHTVAVGPHGTPYDNSFHILFKVRDGKLREAIEYVDPLRALDYLDRLRAAEGAAELPLGGRRP
jgi:uncharacterized protein